MGTRLRIGLIAVVLGLMACGGGTVSGDPTSAESTTTPETASPTTTLAETPPSEAPGATPVGGYADPMPIAGAARGGGYPGAVGDFNGDGHLDIAYGRNSGLNEGPSQTPVILINDGSGGLSDQTSDIITGAVPEFFYVRGVHVADFNADGQDDLFFSNHGKEFPPEDWTQFPCEQNRLLLSDGDGHLEDVTETHLPQWTDFSHGSSAGDVDGDGDVDIWVTNAGCDSDVSSYLLVNDGTGIFGVGAEVTDFLAAADNPFWSQFVDANGDDVVDLVHLNFGSAGVLLNDGTGALSSMPTGAIPTAQSGWVTQGSGITDINGDGLTDVVLFQTPDDYSPGHYLQVLISNGDGTFSDETEERMPPQISTDSQGAPHFWIADLEGDGDQDLFVVLWGPGWDLEADVLDFYVNDGTGVFTELPEDELPQIHPHVIPADVNSDGLLDFLYVSGGVMDGTPMLVLSR